MRNDEFNKIEITNDKQLRGLEFGKTQDSETISQKENKLPEGELNEKYVGKTIRKQTEVNVQYANKATAPAHGSTTVTSTATASNIAATTTTVATAASVVAVTAVAVGTGISVVLHDYAYKFNYFDVTSDSLTYELYVVDHNDERPDGESYEEYDRPNAEENEEESKEPFTLRVYNQAYDYSIPTFYGSNYDSFANLKPNEEYHIVLSENRFGGEIIFDELFTTLKEDTRVSEFRGVTWDKKCNFLTMMMDVQLDYQDDYELFSDFKFNLKSEVMTADSPDGLPIISYDLVKTTEPQQIKLDSNQAFFLAQTYEYSFTYMKEGIEVVADKGTVHFEDNSGAKSEWNNFVFTKKANFINRTFDVQLDFVDDFNVFDNFVLSFYMMYEQEGMTIIDERSEDIPLQKTTEVQTIDLDGIEIMLSDSYHYKLSCDYYDEYRLLDEGNVTFTDTSGAVNKFNELIFDKKANFDTRTFEVQLDYQNDLGYLYGFEFILKDLETGNEKSYYLLEQTTAQTITVDEIEPGTEEDPVYLIDIVKHRMSYSFKYMYQDVENVVVSGEEFKFKNSLVSTFQGIESPLDFNFDEYYDDYLLPIKFTYNDAAHIYEGFGMKVMKNDELYANLAVENERPATQWFYAIFQGMEGHEIEDILDTEVTLKVFANVPSDESDDLEELEVYSEEVTFTYGKENEIYDIDFDSGDEPGSIVNGQYEVNFMPIFTGGMHCYEYTYLTFECESGHTYTMYFNMTQPNQLIYETLRGAAEFNEENFYDDFSKPVKITLVYDTNHEEYIEDNNGSGPTTEIVPDNNPRTKVIHESYLFNIQV